MAASDLPARYRHRVYALALRLMGNESDAADVTQDVLVRLWQHADARPGPPAHDGEPDRERAWVLRITRNACLDALRRRRVRHTEALPDDDHRQPASARRLPDADAEHADFRRLLHAALARLDEPYRSLVILRDLEDYPYQELAETLDLPLTSVKVYLHRARQRLRSALRAALPAEDFA